MSGLAPFKVCDKCGFEWNTIEEFVLDTNLRVNGYQAMLSNADEGLYILTHECPACLTSLSVTVGSLASLYQGVRFTELKFLSPECEGHCFKTDDLSVCKVECSMRWAREVLQYLKEHRLPEKVRTLLRSSG